MNFRATAALLLLLPAAGAVSAQPAGSASPLDELLQSVGEMVRDSVEDSLREALEQVDHEQAVKLLEEMLRRLEKDSVYDLATLKEGAAGLVPLLEQYEETLPYSVWLKTRLDYFDAAGELRRQMQPPPPKRGTPAPLPPPPLHLERAVWTRRLEQRPLPPAAKYFVPALKPIFSAEKVPPQLVWLAEVESSFDPRAKSPAGAAGMFQLMKPTARSLGLSTWLPDERMNPEKSGRAAARYLRHLHQRFGDWRLALAAYNAGEGRVAALLKNSRNRSFEAIAHRLPSQTQMYVPKVEATLKKREGLALADLKPAGG